MEIKTTEVTIDGHVFKLKTVSLKDQIKLLEEGKYNRFGMLTASITEPSGEELERVLSSIGGADEMTALWRAYNEVNVIRQEDSENLPRAQPTTSGGKSGTSVTASPNDSAGP